MVVHPSTLQSYVSSPKHAKKRAESFDSEDEEEPKAFSYRLLSKEQMEKRDEEIHGLINQMKAKANTSKGGTRPKSAAPKKSLHMSVDSPMRKKSVEKNTSSTTDDIPDYVKKLEEQVRQLRKTVSSFTNKTSEKRAKHLDAALLDKINYLKDEHEKNMKAMTKLNEEKIQAEKKARRLEETPTLSSPRASHNQSREIALELNEEAMDKISSSTSDLTPKPKMATSPARKPKKKQMAIDTESLIQNGGFTKVKTPGTTVKPFSFDKSGSDVHKSVYWEEKEREEREREQREAEKEAARVRALRARAPEHLLTREQESKKRKEDRIRQSLEEELAKMKTNRFLARDPPPTTYNSSSDAEKESLRKAQHMQRVAETMAKSKLPPRMQLAFQTDDVTKANRKKKKKEEKSKNGLGFQPKPVPNFAKLQHQWDMALKESRRAHKSTDVVAFEAASAERNALLNAKKLEREKKRAQEEEERKEQERLKQKRLYEKILTAKLKKQPKQTKSHELRAQIVQEKLLAEQKAQQEELIQEQNRKQRLKQMGKEIAGEIEWADRKRKEEYPGNFVELESATSLAHVKAKENKKQFQMAIRQNKQRLEKALAKRPTLMQRFTQDKRTEEKKRQALSTVAANVFGNKLKDMEGIFTEEEEDLVRALSLTDGKQRSTGPESDADSQDDEDDDDEEEEEEKVRAKKHEQNDSETEFQAYQD